MKVVLAAAGCAPCVDQRGGVRADLDLLAVGDVHLLEHALHLALDEPFDLAPHALRGAGIDPAARGETLEIEQFRAIARAEEEIT